MTLNYMNMDKNEEKKMYPVVELIYLLTCVAASFGSSERFGVGNKGPKQKCRNGSNTIDI